MAGFQVSSATISVLATASSIQSLMSRGRCSALKIRAGAADIWIGASGVTTGSGFKIAANTIVEFDNPFDHNEFNLTDMYLIAAAPTPADIILIFGT